jgi:hypothetical protein
MKNVFPGFKHGDLHADNVMLKIVDPQFPCLKQVDVYEVNGKKYYIPWYGIQAKIIDFDLSSMPSKKIISISHNVPWVKARSSDMMMLFEFMESSLFSSGLTRSPFWNNVRELLSKLDNIDIRGLIISKKIKEEMHKFPSEEELLDNKVWDEYLTMPEGYKIRHIYNKLR